MIILTEENDYRDGVLYSNNILRFPETSYHRSKDIPLLITMTRLLRAQSSLSGLKLLTALGIKDQTRTEINNQNAKRKEIKKTHQRSREAVFDVVFWNDGSWSVEYVCWTSSSTSQTASGLEVGGVVRLLWDLIIVSEEVVRGKKRKEKGDVQQDEEGWRRWALGPCP